MNNAIWSAADRISAGLLKLKPFDRLVRFLSYQRKRQMRRNVEARLRADGLYGDTVLEGPFKGMVYPDPERWASCRFEKINGFYESELNECIEEFVKRKPGITDVLNVGAAEGYFAVGFGRLYPEAKIYAFEPAEQKVGVLKDLARINQVEDRLKIEGFCDPAVLSATDVGDSPLLVCDVDGYEEELVDPEKVPWLKNADIILELHDFLVAGISDTIRSRFEQTHDIAVFSVDSVSYSRYPVLKDLAMDEIQAMTDSDRPCIHNWFVMEPKKA